MISSRSDYYYVTGDISSVTINGEIMPRRSAAQQKIIRGEDPCFLLEAGLERLGWWSAFTNLASSIYITNPRAPDSVSFSKAIRKSSSSSSVGIGDVQGLLNSICSVYDYLQGGSNVFTAGFLSALPTIESTPYISSITFEEIARSQDILVESYTFDGLESTLITTPILQLFTAMNRARYAYISFPHTTLSHGSVTSSKSPDDAQWPASLQYLTGSTPMGRFGWSEDRTEWEPVTSNIAYYHFLHMITQGVDTIYSAIADSDYESSLAVFGLRGPAQGLYTSVNAYCLTDIVGSYSYDCTFSPSTTSYQWIVNSSSSGRSGNFSNKIILGSDARAVSRDALYVYYPHLDQSWMNLWATRCGGEWYNESTSSGHQVACDYTFTPNRTILVVPMTRTIY